MKAVTMKLLVQSSEKILSVQWNTKTYPKFVTLRPFFKILIFFSKLEKKNILLRVYMLLLEID